MENNELEGVNNTQANTETINNDNVPNQVTDAQTPLNNVTNEQAATITEPVEPAPAAIENKTEVITETTPVQDTPVVETPAPQQETQPEPVVTPVEPVAPAPAPQTVEQVTTETQKKKSKLPIIIILLVLFVGLGVGGFFLYKKAASNPKTIVNKSIDTLFASTSSFKDIASKAISFDLKKDTVEIAEKLSLSFEGSKGEYASLAELGKIGLNSNTVVSIPKKQISISGAYLENDNSLINLDTFIKDNKFYFKLPDVTNDVYYITLPEDFNLDEIFDEYNKDAFDAEKIDKVINKINEYLKKSIKDEYLKQESGSFNVDGVDVKGIKTSINLSEKRILNIEKDVISLMLEDNEFIDLVSSMSGSEKDDFKKSLTDTKTSCDEALSEASDEITFVINVYTTDMGGYLALDIVSKEEGKDTTIFTSVSKDGVTTNKIEFSYTPMCYDENCSSNDIKIVLLLVNDSKNKTVTLSVKQDNKELASAKISEIDNGYSFDFNYEDFKLNASYTDIVKNDVKNTNAKFDLNGGDLKANLSIDTETKKAEIPKEFDTTNAKDANNLTEEEANKFVEAISKKLENSKIFQMLYSYTEQMSQQYDDYDYTIDYDYDDDFYKDFDEDDFDITFE